jgi:hypothetical protein
MTLLSPGPGVLPILASAVALGLAFVGEAGGALWYLERGWAILAGGWFARVAMMWPGSSFIALGLVAVICALGSMGILLSAMGRMESAEGLIADRIRSEVEFTLSFIEEAAAGRETGFLAELVGTMGEDLVPIIPAMGEARVVLIPALLGLSALAASGVGWWIHHRLTTGSRDALSGIREFRFPDPLIWVMIVGIALMLTGEWEVGSGRVGTNLVAFMGGLYILRGAGVFLALVGSLSLFGGLVLTAGVIIVGPFLLAPAMVVGLSDSWFDLRARLGRHEGGGAG